MLVMIFIYYSILSSFFFIYNIVWYDSYHAVKHFDGSMENNMYKVHDKKG